MSGNRGRSRNVPPGEEARRLAMWAAGATVQEIAASAGRSFRAIEIWLEAHIGTEPPRPGTAKTRNCLVCAGPFASAGAHNHICEDCKTNRDLSGPEAMAWPAAAGR